MVCFSINTSKDGNPFVHFSLIVYLCCYTFSLLCLTDQNGIEITNAFNDGHLENLTQTKHV